MSQLWNHTFGLSNVKRGIYSSGHHENGHELTTAARVDREGQSGDKAGDRSVDLVTLAAEATHQAEDQLVGRVEEHKEEAEVGRVSERPHFPSSKTAIVSLIGQKWDKLGYLQIFEQLCGLYDQREVLEEHLETKADQEICEGLADNVFEAAMVVFADVRFLE